MKLRILNEEELYNKVYNTTCDLSQRKIQAIKYLPQLALVIELSQKANIKLMSAFRVAVQYGHVLSELQEIEKKGEESVPLSLFLVNNDKEYINFNDALNLIIPYQNHFERTGLYLDTDRQDEQFLWEGLWEYIRQSEFPEEPSRLQSCFSFQNQTDMLNFGKELRTNNSKYAIVEDIEVVKQETYDMNWINQVPLHSTFAEAKVYAQKYWAKEMTEQPILETLTIGKITFKDYTSL